MRKVRLIRSMLSSSVKTDEEIQQDKIECIFGVIKKYSRGSMSLQKGKATLPDSLNNLRRRVSEIKFKDN